MRVFRRLLPAEKAELCRHLMRLSAHDRRLRFLGELNDAALAAYCERIDWRRGCVIGCFVDGELRGVAEIQVERGVRPPTAEVALSVEAAWQNQGIGTELLRLAVEAAGAGAVPGIYCICRPDNLRMQRVARKFAARLTRDEDGVRADIAVPQAPGGVVAALESA